MSLSDEAVSKIHKYECVTELENNVLQLNASNNRSTSCFPEFSVFSCTLTKKTGLFWDVSVAGSRSSLYDM